MILSGSSRRRQGGALLFRKERIFPRPGPSNRGLSQTFLSPLEYRREREKYKEGRARFDTGQSEGKGGKQELQPQLMPPPEVPKGQLPEPRRVSQRGAQDLTFLGKPIRIGGGGEPHPPDGRRGRGDYEEGNQEGIHRTLLHEKSRETVEDKESAPDRGDEPKVRILSPRAEAPAGREQILLFSIFVYRFLSAFRLP